MAVAVKMTYTAFFIVRVWCFQFAFDVQGNDGYGSVKYPPRSGWTELYVQATKACYMVSRDRMTFGEANFHCFQHDQNLVFPETDDEEHELNDVLQIHSDGNVDYWLAMKMKDDGQWYYEDYYRNDNTQVNRVNWDSDCAVDGFMAYGNSRRSKWCRTNDADSHYAICESAYIPPPPEPPMGPPVPPSPVPPPPPPTPQVVTEPPAVPPETALCYNGACYSRMKSGLFTLGRTWQERSVLGCASSCLTVTSCASFSFAKSSGVCRVLLPDPTPSQESSLDCEDHKCYMMYT